MQALFRKNGGFIDLACFDYILKALPIFSTISPTVLSALPILFCFAPLLLTAETVIPIAEPTTIPIPTPFAKFLAFIKNPPALIAQIIVQFLPLTKVIVIRSARII